MFYPGWDASPSHVELVFLLLYCILIFGMYISNKELLDFSCII